jgi:transposase-like protein
MAAVARRYPREFRDDVVRVARRHEAPRAQITRDFGISDATLYEWLGRADVNNLMGPDIVFLRDDVTEPPIGEH